MSLIQMHKGFPGQIRKTQLILMLAASALLYWVWLQAVNSGASPILEYASYLFLGITGAVFANSTGAGGGVIFIPAFDYLGLTASQSVATSFAIQCFGMTAGAFSWLRHYRNNHYDDSDWNPLLRIILLCTPFAIAGLWLIETTELLEPPALHLGFSWFSITLGIVIVCLALTRKSTTFRQVLSAQDVGALLIISLMGGVVTAWLSVGVGELVVIYLMMRRFSPAMAVAAGVVISAITVWSASPVHLSSGSDALFALVLFAGPGAIIGGLIAKRLAMFLPISGLKLFFAGWIIMTGIFTLLRHS